MTKDVRRLKSLLNSAVSICALSIAGSALAPVAFAQQSDDQTQAAPAGDYEVITVSARRRDESLQDVPIAVSAYSGDQLEAIGAADITLLQQTTPNITLEVSRGTNTTVTAFIRGVGQQDPVAGFEPGVGIYIDDVYVNRPQGAVLDIYDVERIEILRGPQGTLYGRNTIGGAIKYVTRKLSTEPELKLRATGGTFNQTDFVGTFSAPLTDTLRVGGTVGVFKRDGFGDNLFLEGVENYNKDVLAGRVSMEWEPSDNLFFRIAGDYLDDDSDPRQGHRLIDGQFTPGAFPVLDDVFDTRSGLNDPRQEVQTRGISFLSEWRLNDQIKIKNVLAYRDGESQSPIDFDSLPVADLDVPVRYEDDQLSEELQIIYEGDRVQGVAGFYYLDARAFNIFESILGTLGDLPGGSPLTGLRVGDVDTSTWAVFGDFSYSLTDTVSISLGGRYTSDERTALIRDQLFIGEGTGLVTGEPGFLLRTDTDDTFNETFTDFSPRASITWEPNENVTTYFSYSQGFKGGGFDPRGDAIQAVDLNGDGNVDDNEIFEFIKFEPEEVDTYEFGVKSSLFGGRVNSSFAFFYSDYQNVQIPGSVGVDADNDGIAEDFAGVTTNAGEARIFGIEYEGLARLIETDFGSSFSANWSLGWLDAEYQEFLIIQTDPNTMQAVEVDVSDIRTFQNTPEWTASLYGTWSTPKRIVGNDGDLALTAGFAYRSETSQFEVRGPLDQPGYTLIDASLVWSSADGKWQAGVHGKNLTDKEYIVAGYDFVNAAVPLGLEGTLTAFYGNPRQIFGTVQVKF